MEKRQETRNYVRPELHVFLMQSRRHLMDYVSFGGTGDFDVKQEANHDWDIWNSVDDGEEGAPLRH